MSWHILFLSLNHWPIVLLVWLLKVISTVGFFSFRYRCVFHFLFHQMTLLCDCGLMGKFSWVWVFFSWKYLKRFISETIPHFFRRWLSENMANLRKTGKLFYHCFAWNTNILQETRTVKRAKLQQFSTVECNFIGFCFGADTIGSKKKIVYRTRPLRPWQTRTLCCGHIVTDTNASPFARARNICCGHKFCVRDTKNVLILFRNILCPQQMFPSLRSPRDIMGNNVSSFTRSFTQTQQTSWCSFREQSGAKSKPTVN